MKKNVFRIFGIIFICTMLVTLTGCGIDTKKILNNLNQEINRENQINTFYGEGYDLKYNSEWEKYEALSTDNKKTDALTYKRELYLVPMGVSSLSEFEKSLNIDFSNYSGQKKLYDEFSNNWNKGSYIVSGGSYSFRNLKDDISYAYMNYKDSSNNRTGNLYLIVSKSNNIVISLMSDTTNSSSKDDSKIMDILRTINITKKYDNEMASYLDAMSNWNRYSSSRQGASGMRKDINGEWKVLSSSDSYWVFKNNEFWWYKSQKDLNDNYWYGKTRIMTGKEGIKAVGLSEDNYNRMIANNSGKVSENNIYTIIFTPSKIISDGTDKSSTNITGEDWHMVWILVDHGSDGLEAQVLNVKNQETSYYVKYKD
ncbi:MAG: hypothetical protein IKE01_04510 [Clostridia bacterium]|nr:hypothetical protein [Clostridia bacterium]